MVASTDKDQPTTQPHRDIPSTLIRGTVTRKRIKKRNATTTLHIAEYGAA